MKQILLFLFLSAFVLLTACKDNITTELQPLPFNPYDTLDYDDNVIPTIPVDSTTFLGIHKYILATKCAQPACHDGAFEPDYRTVQSSYNTLVFASVVKNNPSNTFVHRVVPGDTAMSWLHERITTNDAILGRMPLYDTLPKRQIQLITNWILGGAKDIFGNTPQLPNPQPSFFGLVAYLTSNNMRIDTMRGTSPVNPFLVPANSEVDIWFGVYDDNTYPFLLGDKTIKFSTNPLDFSNSVSNPLLVELTPFMAPAFTGVNAPYFLHYKVNTANYNSGDVVYMRVYVKDNDHLNSTEIPSGSSPFYLQTYFSFVVQ